MDFKQVKDNFIEVFSNKINLVIFLFILFLFLSLFSFFTEDDVIKGNMGIMYYYINSLTQLLISVLFALFIPISIHKFRKFNSFSPKENSTSIFGSIFGILVAGCPACSISIASYIGLASVISLLPYYGLELKIIAMPMLIYANYSLLKDLNVCKVNVKKKR